MANSMAPQTETSATKLTSKEGTSLDLCSECKLNPYKYKCPGCSLRSCSLPCVKAHKTRTACTGKRTRQTEFVPISRFDDNLLISDYNMLEEVKRVAESARRVRSKLGENFDYGENINFRLPYPLRCLRSAAGRRSIKLEFLPNGMSKRVTNQSSYNYRKKFISWTIEWRFHSTNVVIVDHGINENTDICSVIKSHLKPGPWAHPLKHFCEEPLDSLRFFIRKYKGPKSPFLELDIKSPISQQLANLFILEYPVIHVFLPSHSFNFEIVKSIPVKKPAIKEYVVDEPPSPKGVIFKEEEIEETNSQDTQVVDLNKQSDQNCVLAENTDKSCKSTSENFENAQDNDEGVELGEFDIDELFTEDIDFDFEPGMIDAYSDLIAQHNPDDYLDFKNIFLEEARTCTGSADAEELEEGEIPEA